MNSSALTLEFELQANAIAASAYPHTRYSLISEIDSKCVSIEFKGFFTVDLTLKIAPIKIQLTSITAIPIRIFRSCTSQTEDT